MSFEKIEFTKPNNILQGGFNPAIPAYVSVTDQLLYAINNNLAIINNNIINSGALVNIAKIGELLQNIFVDDRGGAQSVFISNSISDGEQSVFVSTSLVYDEHTGHVNVFLPDAGIASILRHLQSNFHQLIRVKDMGTDVNIANAQSSYTITPSPVNVSSSPAVVNVSATAPIVNNNVSAAPAAVNVNSTAPIVNVPAAEPVINVNATAPIVNLDVPIAEPVINVNATAPIVNNNVSAAPAAVNVNSTAPIVNVPAAEPVINVNAVAPIVNNNVPVPSVTVTPNINVDLSTENLNIDIDDVVEQLNLLNKKLVIEGENLELNLTEILKKALINEDEQRGINEGLTELLRTTLISEVDLLSEVREMSITDVINSKDLIVYNDEKNIVEQSENKIKEFLK